MPLPKLTRLENADHGALWSRGALSIREKRQLEEALMLGDPITELTIALEVNYF